MNPRIGLAVIGLGVIGRRMLEQTARRDDFAIAGAWDVDASACARARADFPHARVAADADAAIGAAAAEVVYVGTPPAFHASYARRASALGRRVFCEKPLAASVDEGERLVRDLDAAGTPNAVNFVYASAPAARALAAAIASGAIGRPTGVETRLFFSRWPRDWQASAAWLALRAEGGFVREVLSHFVYLMTDLFGDCAHRASFTDYPPGGVLCERASVALLDCAGVPATVAASAGGAGPDEVTFTVRGERGALRLENWYGLARSDGAAWVPVDVDPRPHADARTAAYQAQLDSLARFARGEPHRLPTMEVALRVQRVIDRILAEG